MDRRIVDLGDGWTLELLLAGELAALFLCRDGEMVEARELTEEEQRFFTC